MIDLKWFYPSPANRFSSVVVITFASHAKGPGFDPQLNHHFFLLVSGFTVLVIQCSAFWRKKTPLKSNNIVLAYSEFNHKANFIQVLIISCLNHQMYTIYPCQNIEYPAIDYDYLIQQILEHFNMPAIFSIFIPGKWNHKVYIYMLQLIISFNISKINSIIVIVGQFAKYQIEKPKEVLTFNQCHLLIFLLSAKCTEVNIISLSLKINIKRSWSNQSWTKLCAPHWLSVTTVTTLTLNTSIEVAWF